MSLQTPLVYLLHQKAGLLAFGVNHPFDESKHNIMVHYKNCTHSQCSTKEIFAKKQPFKIPQNYRYFKSTQKLECCNDDC
jgi:hypothetical protein